MSFKSENGHGFHSFPQMSSKEKTDIKRVRGQISCAECRRLKLRCDKKLPCSSCVRRGYESLCPTETTGSVTSSHGKRSSEATALHSKMEDMGRRINQLEEALAALQSMISSEPHPLLKGESSASKTPSEDVSPEPPNLSTSSEIADALGTLKLGEDGDARYLGRSAGSESLLAAAPEVHRMQTDGVYHPFPSKGIAHLANSFPFASSGTWDVPQSMMKITSYLPEKRRAWFLCDIYLSYTLFKARLVTREELFDELLRPVYQYLTDLEDRSAAQKSYDSSDDDLPQPLHPSRLAVLFFALAHGALADYTSPMYNLEAEHYFDLGRASLSLHPVFASPDLGTVQALAMAGLYLDHGGLRYTVEGSWGVLTLAAKLAHSIGLHRESPRWGMDAKTLTRRRSVFWEIFIFDSFLSLSLGRPPSINLSNSDCQIAEDDDDSINADGKVELGFHHWRMTFARDVVSHVTDAALSLSLPEYQTILDLERRIREHPLPQKYDVMRSLSSTLEKDPQYSSQLSGQLRTAEDGYEASIAPMKGFSLAHLQAMTSMYIHRVFFAQALLQSPSNPLESTYATSYLAAYRAASTVIHLNVDMMYKWSELLLRSWAIWTGILTAGIIVAMIVTRSPTSSLAANAYSELNLVVDLFRIGAAQSPRARRGLEVMLRLQEKAAKAYTSSKSQTPERQQAMNVTQEDAEALHDLEVFAGHTKLLMNDMTSKAKIMERSRPDTQSDSPMTDPDRGESSVPPAQSNAHDLRWNHSSHLNHATHLTVMSALGTTGFYPSTGYQADTHSSESRYHHPQQANNPPPPLHRDQPSGREHSYTSLAPSASSLYTAQADMTLSHPEMSSHFGHEHRHLHGEIWSRERYPESEARAHYNAMPTSWTRTETGPGHASEAQTGGYGPSNQIEHNGSAINTLSMGMPGLNAQWAAFMQDEGVFNAGPAARHESRGTRYEGKS